MNTKQILVDKIQADLELEQYVSKIIDVDFEYLTCTTVELWEDGGVYTLYQTLYSFDASRKYTDFENFILWISEGEGIYSDSRDIHSDPQELYQSANMDLAINSFLKQPNSLEFLEEVLPELASLTFDFYSNNTPRDLRIHQKAKRSLRELIDKYPFYLRSCKPYLFT